MTLQDLVTRARTRFVRAGIGPVEAELDAELLARHLLGWDQARYLSEKRQTIPDGSVAAYEHLVARRERREPVGYIIGRREFWGLEFEIDSDVLIPRPETELIVEEALACRKDGRLKEADAFIVDVGTGSGCIAIALALEMRAAQVTATETSAAALRVARRNAARHGVAERIKFLQTTLLDAVPGSPSLIVSNPPYVRTVAVPELPPEVREHEPREALVAGHDGLDAIRGLLAQAERRLMPGGWLIFEFGYDQADSVREAAARHPALFFHSVREDLQGIPRTAVLQKVVA